MHDRRSFDRSMSYAKTVFLFYDIIGYVRDISPSGVRVDIFADSVPQVGEQIHTTIISHPDLELDPFNVLTQIRWTREDGPMMAIGLKVIGYSSEHGKLTYRELTKVFENLRAKQV